MGCQVSADIARLQAEQKRVREERKQVANELRNAQKRKQILKHRARLLSNDDIMMVAAMRECEQARRTAISPALAEREATLEPVASLKSEEGRSADRSTEVHDEKERDSQQ